VSLTPGTRLGAYEILAVLGAGGMGVVYRARDAKLQRDVALKVLPNEWVGDAERLARFKREAQLLASLNHTNIGSIYGFEDADGSPALVLELIEGPTLADRLALGPLPLDTAIAIATQVADALEAAHEQGIVHRDLKPANIKIRPDGTVKVLDFGLAKALDTGAVSQSVVSSPTITSPAMTRVGGILGTAAYMSPEQAKGSAADRRSDIWAYGAVLYEMLSGQRAFAGDDVVETLASVLRAEPTWNALPTDTPASIRRLLRRCLHKDPRRRLQHIGDARLELTDADVAEPTTQIGTPRSRYLVWLIAAAMAAGAATAGLALWMRTPPPVVRPVTRFSIQAPELVARVFGSGSSVALSPDGRTLVYVVGGTRAGLERRQFHNGTTERLRGAELGRRPFFSPGGDWVGFFADGKLKKVPIAGGDAVPICDVAPGTRGAWSDDGTTIVLARPDLRKVAATGGTPEVILPSADGEQFAEPEFLPGSKVVLVQARVPPNPGYIEAVDLETRRRQRLFEGASPKLTATGDLLFVRQGRLWATKFNSERLEVVGTPVQLPESVNFLEGAAGEASFATSKDGTLVFVTGDASASLVWVTPQGASTIDLSGPAAFRNPRLSPDGSLVAVNETAPAVVSVVDLRRGSRRRLTTEGYRRGGAWSPKGDRIAFFSLPAAPDLSPAGAQDLYIMPSDGGKPTKVLDRPGPQWADSWSPDERYLIFDDGPGYSRDLWVLPFGDAPRQLVATRFNERSGAFSPNGRWFAYVSDESGRDEVYVQPFQSPGPRVVVSNAGGRQPVWSRDGTQLFYRAGDDLMTVSVAYEPFRPAVPRKLLDLPGAIYGLDPYVPEYDVAPDGRFIAVRRDGAPEIQVVLNWVEELTRALR
jgi:eukaryotic-like serine/threonine-protein kinase